MRKLRTKFSLLDYLVVGVVAAGVAFFVWRINVGLDYDWRWGLLVQYILRYDEAAGNWVPGQLLEGLLATVRIAAWSMVFASLVGTVMGLARTSRRLFPRMVGRTYVELVRNIPPLVLIYIVYFFLSDQIMAAVNIDAAVRAAPQWVQNVLAVAAAPVQRMPNFVSALITMAVYEGAFITEHVRAGVQSIERGQREAAMALGFTGWQAMQHVIFPQALARIIPPVAGQFIAAIKDTAILAVISVQELTFQAIELLASTYMTFETMITLTGMYLLLTLTCSFAARKLELRLQRGR